MNRRNLFTISALLLVALSIQAIPARKGLKKQITLSNGEKVTAELCGDEFFSYWKTDEGKKYVLDADKEVFTQNQFDQFFATGMAKRAKANAMRAQNIASVKGMPGTRAGLGSEHQEYKGKKKGLIILVNYTDTKFGFGHNQAFFNRIANETGYTSSLGFVGSVKDYFLAQSNGQFELDFDVVGPYTLPHDHAYYGRHSSDGSNDARPGSMIRDAVRLADADVDFTQYDWNGDNYVDQVYVLYAGLGEAAGGDANTIWPHEWYLSSSDVGSAYETQDNVFIDRYATGSELQLNRLGNRQVGGIGTLCHEFSHCLGLPDLYDTQGGNYGMGTWDLLDQGSYNDADGRQGLGMCPPNYSAYEKIYCGWAEPTVLDRATTVKGVQAQHEKYGQIFAVVNDNNPNEYYLLENRRKDNGDIWDQGIAASGLMIQYVDYADSIWNYNIVNATSGTIANYFHHDHQSLTIFHADNTTANPEGDLYPYNGNNSLTDTSTPAATIYNGGSFMGKPITNITQNADGTIDFDFMGGSSTNVISAIKGVTTVEKTSNAYYTLDGRYVGSNASALPSGIYIRNGKKFVKK